MVVVARTVATPPARTTPSSSNERRENRVDQVVLRSVMEVSPNIGGSYRVTEMGRGRFLSGGIAVWRGNSSDGIMESRHGPPHGADHPKIKSEAA
jgi:hypothetical protein